MKKINVFLFTLTIVSMLFVQSAIATMNPITVYATSGTAGPTSYASLKLAFDKINDGTHKGVINVAIEGNVTEGPSFPILRASGNGGALYNSIKIYPTSKGLTITGNNTSGPIIWFIGADNVTIDGSYSGGPNNPILPDGDLTKDLTIVNTSNGTGESTIQFSGGATNNTIQYCKIKGSAINSGDPSHGGVIFFYTGGNTGNTIQYCDISDDGTNFPNYGIISNGSSGAGVNSGITIKNNNIFNFWSSSANSSAGIYLYDYSSDWTISGNSFYQTVTRTGISGTKYYGINITYRFAAAGNNFVIKDNYIGGSAPECGGDPLTVVGDVGHQFYGMYLILGTVITSSVQNNKIKNINYTGGYFMGLYPYSGNIDIGTETGNIIGDSIGTGSIKVTREGVGNYAYFYGIYTRSTGTVNIKNNIIGSVTLDGGALHNFYGIYKYDEGIVNISDNLIGSKSTANSIQAITSTQNYQEVNGILSDGTGTVTITGNTIANLNNASTGTSGVFINGINCTAGVNTIENNTVRNLTTASGTSGNYQTVVGIRMYSETAGAQTVKGNTIYALSNTNSSGAVAVMGMLIYGNQSGTYNVYKNFIHSLSLSTSSSLARIVGLMNYGGIVSYSNNIISLGYGITTDAEITGFYDFNNALLKNDLAYYNTVYIGGTASSTSSSSYAFRSVVNVCNRDIRNNIFYNGRSNSGGTAKHYAALFDYTSAGSLTLDYNNYYAPGTGGVLGRYANNDKIALPIVTDKDAHSLITDPAFANAGGTEAEDYKPTADNILAATGTGILTDYAGTTRSETIPAMGAWEIAVSPGPSAPTGDASQSFCTSGTVADLTASGTAIKWYDAATGGNLLSSGTALVTATHYYASQTVDGLESSSRLDVLVTINTKPSIGTQPREATKCSGSESTFTVAATGSLLSYNWQSDGVNLTNTGVYSNVTTATMNISDVTGLNGKKYKCIISGVCTPAVTSNEVILTVNELPIITKEPESVRECAGKEVSFTLSATGTSLSYQWKENEVNLSDTEVYSGVTTNEMTISDITGLDDKMYKCVVSGACTPSATSEIALLIEYDLPVITEQPSGSSICRGDSATLSVSTEGSHLLYQWKIDDENIDGATNSVYKTNAGGSYTVLIINGNECSTLSDSAIVKLYDFAEITEQPTGTTLCQGDTATLSVAADGTEMLYQWKLNDEAIVGATNSVYKTNAEGSYTVVIYNVNECSIVSDAAIVKVNELPLAEITPDGATIFCEGNSVMLNANTGTGLKYQWKKNNIDITGATLMSYNVNASATYSMVVTDGNNCKKTSNDEILTVYPQPTAVITPQGPNSFCSGADINLILNANTGTDYKYQWKYNGEIIEFATNSFYTVNSTGNYIVAVSSSNNCIKYSQPFSVSMLTATITPVSKTKFCQGGNVVLRANYSLGLNYQWKRNNVNIPGATAFSYTASISGSYTVTENLNNECTSTSGEVIVTVMPLPTANIITLGTTTLCPDAQINIVLNANAGSGYKYQWKNNGENIEGATNLTYIANTTGNYVVEVTNSSNCIKESQALPINLLTATINTLGNTTFCKGGRVILLANNSQGLVYQWKRNNVNIPGATTSSYTARESGSYTVTETFNNTCANTSGEIVVTVNPVPAAIITPSGATTFCPDSPVNVVLDANTGEGLKYQWIINNINIPGATTSSYTAITDGKYSVQVINSTGCSMYSASLPVSTLMPTITPQGPIALCQGSTVMLKTNSAIGAKYQWQKNNLNISSATSSNYTVNSSGNYNVIVSLGNICSLTSDAVTVTVNPTPSVTVTTQGSNVFCPGSEVSKQINANANQEVLYQWKNNGTDISGATNSTYTSSAIGDYTVYVVNSNNCFKTSSAVSLKTITSTISPSGTKYICQGYGTPLKANTGQGLNYQWKKDGNNIPSATLSEYYASEAGLYTVIMGIGEECSVESVGVIIKVNPSPETTITPSGRTAICEGSSIMLVANEGAGLKYQWRKDISLITGATNSTYTTALSGSYSVTETNLYNCTKTSRAVVIITNPLPVIDLGNDVTINLSQNIVLDAGTGFSSYLWNTGAIKQTLLVKGSVIGYGSHTYSVTVTNSESCQASDSIHVIVRNPIKKLTDGSDNITEQSQPNLFNNYPNPFSGVTNIEYYLPETAQVTLKVYNILGREISELVNTTQSEGNYKLTFNADKLADGIYTLSINVKSENINFNKTKLMILNNKVR